MWEGLLIVNSKKSDLNNYFKFAHLKTLFIYILPALHNNIIETIHFVEKLFNHFTKHYKNLDVRILTSHYKDIYYKYKFLPPNIYAHTIDGFNNIIQQNFICGQPNLEEVNFLEQNEINNFGQLEKFKVFRKSALGGTFDRLHNGHKYLLTIACLYTKEVLTCGVTHEKLLKKKELYDIIYPLDVRMQDVEKYLNSIAPDLRFNIVPLHDVYGPTIFDPDIECCFLTPETISGGNVINVERQKRNLGPLHLYTISYIDKGNNIAQNNTSQDNAHHLKLSSTQLRKESLGQLDLYKHHLSSQNNGNINTETQSNPFFPLIEKLVRLPRCFYPPYIIGLTGPICSGKSLIANKLFQLCHRQPKIATPPQKMSFDVHDDRKISHLFYYNPKIVLIDCDKICHELYNQPNACMIAELQKIFGKDVFISFPLPEKSIKGSEMQSTDNNDNLKSIQINRSKLAQIVFADKEKLAMLNAIMWPTIFTRVQETIKSCTLNENCQTYIVILEAALLIQAGWSKYVHELWVTFAPLDMACDRLMARNNLDRESAQSRIDSQPPVKEYLDVADVRISTQYNMKEIVEIIERAWISLIKRIGSYG